MPGMKSGVSKLFHAAKCQIDGTVEIIREGELYRPDTLGNYMLEDTKALTGPL